MRKSIVLNVLSASNNHMGLGKLWPFRQVKRYFRVLQEEGGANMFRKEDPELFNLAIDYYTSDVFVPPEDEERRIRYEGMLRSVGLKPKYGKGKNLE
jgi:hypothetical protein